MNDNELADLARQFHDTYERLAHEFSYTTRKASAVPWDDVPENNRRLMEATVEAVMGARLRELSAEVERQRMGMAAIQNAALRLEAENERLRAAGDRLRYIAYGDYGKVDAVKDWDALGEES